MKTFLIVAGVLLVLVAISVIVFVHFNKKRYIKGPRDTSYNPIMARRRRRLAKVNESAMHGQIVLFGDSITEFYKVNKHYHLDIEVQNRGISGDTTDRMVERMDDNVLVLEPKKLFVLAGVNDIEKLLTDDETIANLREIIDKAKKSGVKDIYIESIYPVNKKYPDMAKSIRTNERILVLNEKIESLAQEMSVTYIDVHPHLTDEEGNLSANYTNDGLHPNENGYEVITRLLTPYMVE